MSVTIYTNYQLMPARIDELLAFDETRCAIGVTCKHENRNAVIGGYLSANSETGQEEAHYATVAVLEVPGEEPVLCCEDCAGWLVEATGGRLHEVR